MPRRSLTLSLLLILSVAHASSFGDYLKNGVVGKITNKVLSQVTLTVTVENSALWQNPLPYYLSVFKRDAKAESGYHLMESHTLTLQADSLHSEQMGPAKQTETSVIFESNQTYYPGTYLVAIHGAGEFDPRTPAATSPWLLPQLQSFEVGAKPKNQELEFLVQGYPEVKTE